jgi:signal transduction histidine kinase
MKIRTRLILLLGCLLAFLGTSVGLLQAGHRKEVRAIFASLRAERNDLLDRLLALTGQSLHTFVSDYSLWDEMVQFTRTGDPAWAAINIDASLPNFNAQAACVVRPDGTVLYGTGLIQDAPAGLLPVPIDDPLFLQKLREQNSLHFFHDTATGFYEVRTAAIQPSDDLRRKEVPRGWLLVARRWDEKQLRTLAGTLQSHVTLTPPGPVAENSAVIRLQREFADWRGQPLRTLSVEYRSQPLVELFKSNRDEAVLLIAFGTVIILVVVAGLSHWVIRPLHRLGQSLEAGTSKHLGKLPHSTDEFGHIARQVAQSFEQRDALRASEERHRQSGDLRGRLARDLHDGIIQSIYAAGLGLESARNLRATDPAGAEQRLAICQQMLNDTLWQVRNFIEALEPEDERQPTLAQSLSTLATTMRSLQDISILAEADHNLARRIGRHQEMHLLQMAREAVSNALRHSGASQVRISLKPAPNGRAVLEIADDGTGFDPALHTGTGRGLLNLTSRTREIGATLAIESSPGKGARITIQFSPMP